MFFENINDLNNLFGINNSYNYAYDYQNNSNQELSSAFLRGNMFDDEFVSYKNMKYIRPNIKSDRERNKRIRRKRKREREITFTK